MTDSSKTGATSQHLKSKAVAPATKPHTIKEITDLPFVSIAAGSISENRNFWTVEPSGDYGEECHLGTEYAHLAIDYMITRKMPFLYWVANDMRLSETSGINVGFMETIAEMAINYQALRAES